MLPITRERELELVALAKAGDQCATPPREIRRGGHCILIDASDAWILEQSSFRVVRIKRCFYVRVSVNGERKYLHRMIIGATDGETVDHKNCNGLDNRRLNLRLANHSESSANRRKFRSGAVRFKGVYYNPKECIWIANICVLGKRFRLRNGTALSAAISRDELARQHFGEFARLNFPERFSRQSTSFRKRECA